MAEKRESLNRFLDNGFVITTVERGRAKQRKVAKEQKAAVAKSLADNALVTSVEAQGEIWLL